ncbi:MAG: hypothetical protein JXB45_02515 [Candidatus Krumholzibacteriota bacterium]|nr:hypothetical protein [Candidatus Krumholzibacteriota bacterium]
MRRLISVLVAVALLLLGGCKSKHPSLIKIEPEFNPGSVQTIVISPVISSVTKGEDPNRESERITERVLWNQVSIRSDYRFIAPNQFMVALAKEKLRDDISEYKEEWIKNNQADPKILQAVKTHCSADLVLIPHVYLWYKDEADYREAGTASVTQVGITISLVEPLTGKILWEATDENYKEAVRTEGERVRVTSDAGIDRIVSGRTATGKDMYAAPPYEDVAMMVIEAIINAIPQKLTKM